jgi:hypothetical protein
MRVNVDTLELDNGDEASLDVTTGLERPALGLVLVLVAFFEPALK